MQDRDLLRLGRDDEIPRPQRGGDGRGHFAHVALHLRGAVDRPQDGDQRQADEPEPSGIGKPGGGQQQPRPQRRRQVAVGPGGGELGRQPGHHDRQHGDDEQRQHRAPGWRQPPRVAAGEQHDDPGAAREQHRDLRLRAEQLGRSRGERREARRPGPRRSGVRGLVEHVGQPGQVEQRREAVAQQPRERQPAPLGPARERQQHEPRHACGHAEEQRPVVGVEHRRQADREADRRRLPDPSPASAYGLVTGFASRGVGGEGLQPAGQADQPEQRDQRVHPALLRVLRQPGVERREQGRDPGRAAAEQQSAGPVGDGDAEEAEDDREPVHRRLGAARELEPEVEQEVVERR